AQGPTLDGRLVHHVDRNISDMLRRLDRYTSLRAQDLRESGQIGTFAHNLRRIAPRFWKCYIPRRCYREGPWGFLIALCAALYPILSYLKARLEAPHPPIAEDMGPTLCRTTGEGAERSEAGEGCQVTSAHVAPLE